MNTSGRDSFCDAEKTVGQAIRPWEGVVQMF